MKHRLYTPSYRFVFFLTLALLLSLSAQLFLLPVAAAQAAMSPGSDSGADVSWPSGPSVNAESAVVLELSTGTVLYEKNAEEAKYPASITKVMTALLAVENCSMDEIVEFTEEAVYGNGIDSSSIGMNVGETLSMENCMYGMMLASGNEVAKAIGEHVGGSSKAFVDMMNNRAKELGCVNTHFANSCGLHDENHYTCAYDMALIAQAAIRSSTFKKIAGTRVYEIPPTEKMEETRWVANTHQMVNPAKLPQFAYEDCYAGKTGFTNEARYTLVTFAKRENLDVVCVTMHSQMQVNQYEDTTTLLDYVFDNFSVQAISKLDQAPSFDNFSLFTRFSPLFDMKNAPLSIDTDSYVILPNGASYADVKQTITYHPVEVLQKGANAIGQVTYQYGDKIVGYTDILYESAEDLSLSNIEQNGTSEKDTTSPNGTEPKDTLEESDADLAVTNQDTASSDSTDNHTADNTEDTKQTKKEKSLKPFIITGIVLFLVALGVLYCVLVELPYRRRRNAYFARRKKRREEL